MSLLNRHASRNTLVFTLIVVLFSLGLTGPLAPAGATQSVQSPPPHSPVGGQLVALSLARRVEQAALVVEAQVLARACFWDDRRANIYTANRLQVYKVFKGEVASPQLTVLTEGGLVGNEMMVASNALELREGQMGVFLLEPARAGVPAGQTAGPFLMAYGGVQGFIRYDLVDRSAADPFRAYADIEGELFGELRRLTGAGYREVQDNLELKNSRVRPLDVLATPVITGLSPNPITAGTDAVLTITGNNFGATRGSGFVDFRNADNGGMTFTQPMATDYVSWANTQIQVRVPTLPAPAGTGVIRVTNGTAETGTSTQTLTVNYGITNINFNNAAKIPFLTNDDGTGGFAFQFNTAFAANVPAGDAFIRAMNTWTCATMIHWDRNATNTVINTSGSDGVNVVAFDTAAPLPAGVAGRAFTFYSSCDGTNWGVTEMDVLFDDATSWQFGPAPPGAGQIDFESVALHELGHAHQLQHVINPGAVMHYQILAGTMARVLSANDTAAGNFVMARSTVPLACGFLSMTAKACPPTAVELVDFAALDYGNGVLLRWQTGREVDNLGFNLYRDDGNRRALITRQPVAGSALTAGSTLLAGQNYVYWDDAPGKGAAYWLEDIDLKGQATVHGPVYARPGAGKPPAPVRAVLLSEVGRDVSNLQAATGVEARVALARPSPAQTAQAINLAASPAVKIAVRREGWYRLTQAELVEAGLSPAVDPRTLQLFAEGREQRIRVTGESDGRFDPQDAVEFYGTGLDSPFTTSRTYWLVAGIQPGRRIRQVAGEGSSATVDSFTCTVERRDRSVYFAALRNSERENFFGAVVTATPVEQSITLSQVATAATEAALEITLQGVTLGSHRVKVEWNSAEMGEVAFDGQAQGVARFNLPPASLREGPNNLRLIAAGGPGDVSLVDTIRVAYPRRFTVTGDALTFTAPAGRQVTVEGFATGAIRVIDVTVADEPQEVLGTIKREAGGYGITFAAPGDGERRLLAFTSPQTPAGLSLNQPSKLKKLRADYLIITRRQFVDSLRPLAALRQSEGLTIALVDVEDIYDEFSFGTRSPLAIRDFLASVSSGPKKKPRFLLLAGDASYDPKNYLGLGDADVVPTRLVDTEWMETASDDWFSDFNGDGIGDIATGRWPARTAAEMERLVAKIVGYETAGPSEEALLVADQGDGFDFGAADRELLALLPSQIRATRLNGDHVVASEARQLFLDGLHRRQLLVNYAGHGSATQWRGGLLTGDDALALNNDHLPLFVMMTCLNGYFQDAGLNSLAEALMKAERGGAVAVWASSGMAPPAEQALLNQALYRQLFDQGQAPRLGEAVRRAKAAVSGTDIRRTWILFGDPTVRLK